MTYASKANFGLKAVQNITMYQNVLWQWSAIPCQVNINYLFVQFQKILADNPANLKGLADPAIRGSFALNSLRTVVEVSLSCISKDPKQRPSIDDILWNLQYSVQVQDGWGSSENLSFQM